MRPMRRFSDLPPGGCRGGGRSADAGGRCLAAEVPLTTETIRQTESTEIIPCWVCGATFLYKGRRGDLNGRFCSFRCQTFFDDGNAPPDAPADTLIGYRVIAGPGGVETDFYATLFGRPPIAMKRSTDGFRIACAGCGKEFESRGLRCCSDACERQHRERQGNMAVMAEVGMEPAATKRKCAFSGCGNTIPKWRDGRRVSKATRFCSPKCSRKAGQ
jgi:hypothetical protein